MSHLVRCTLAVCLLVLAGCDRGPENVLPTAVDPTMSQPRTFQGKPLEGNLLITGAPNGKDVIFAFDAGGERPADGISDEVFMLQRNGGLEDYEILGSKGILLKHVSIRVSTRNLQIYHPDLSAYVLLSDESSLYGIEAGRDLLGNEQQAPVGAYQAVWDGYGLSRSFAKVKMSVRDMQDQSVRGFCGANLVKSIAREIMVSPESGCASGGGGASGCSIEAGSFSCSVSCGGGYYACCNLLGGCKCKAYAAEPAE